jgi:hypothetical protein
MSALRADPYPGVAVKIGYRLPSGSAMPAPWPENAQINNGYITTGARGHCTHEYWPVTANGIMLYSLWRSHGVRALCVSLGP